MSHTTSRLALIDWLRALAIVLMVIYHFSWDLAMMQLIEQRTFSGPLMTFIGRSCLCLFLFCVGYSLALSHTPSIRWRPFWRRWLKIVLAAAAVSLATYVYMPTAWVYFGILHCIAVASLLGLLFLRIPLIALLAGSSLMISWWLFGSTLPWLHLPRPSLDYIALFPWSGMVLIGIGAHHYRLHERIRPPALAAPEWLSRHSLAIYLLHQPLLLGLAFLLGRLAVQ